LQFLKLQRYTRNPISTFLKIFNLNVVRYVFQRICLCPALHFANQCWPPCSNTDFLLHDDSKTKRFALKYFKSRDSSVGIVTDYGLNDQMIGVRILAGAGNFSPRHRVQTASGAHPASYPMRTMDSFLGG
jgi:hypothetical protein